MPPYVFRSGTGHQGRQVAAGPGGSNIPHGSHLVPGLSSGYQQGAGQRDTASGGGRRIGLPPGAPRRGSRAARPGHSVGGGRKLTAAQRRQQADRRFLQALKKAGVHPVPYQGGPWSIFTNGGGDLVAKVWAEELLKSIGAPTSPGNVAFIYQWEKSEGGGGQYNPLNQGEVPGQPQLTYSSNPQFHGGAAGYKSWEAGIAGAKSYLFNESGGTPGFQGIAAALRANNPALAKQRLIASPWAKSHYGGGANWANVAPPGGSIPSLPPLSNVPIAGPPGGVSPAPSPTPGVAPSAAGGKGTRAGIKQSDTTAGGGGTGGGGGGGGGSSGLSGPAGTGATASGPSGGGGGLTGIFTELPGTGGVETLLGTSAGIADVGNALATASNTFSTVVSSVDWLFVPSHWVRILAGIGGTALTVGGVFQLSHTGSTVNVPMMGDVSSPRAVSLPLGILMVGAGGVLLFVAFHNLPSTVDNFPALVGWLSDEIRSGGKTPAFPPDQPPTPVAKAPVAGGIVGHVANAIKDFLNLISGGLAGIGTKVVP